MLGSSPLASGTIAVGTLGRRTLRMTLTGSGSYAGRGYSGTRSASVGLVLQRRSFHVVFQGGGGR
jgi:hypothetical protein